MRIMGFGRLGTIFMSGNVPIRETETASPPFSMLDVRLGSLLAMIGSVPPGPAGTIYEPRTEILLISMAEAFPVMECEAVSSVFLSGFSAL